MAVSRRGTTRRSFWQTREMSRRWRFCAVVDAPWPSERRRDWTSWSSCAEMRRAAQLLTRSATAAKERLAGSVKNAHTRAIVCCETTSTSGRRHAVIFVRAAGFQSSVRRSSGAVSGTAAAVSAPRMYGWRGQHGCAAPSAT